MTGFQCIECGEQNYLGDVCPLCVSFDCDECANPIDFDGDILDEITGDRLCTECAEARGVIK